MEEQCKAILLPPKTPDCFLCWETLQILIARHLAKEADRLIADLHLSPLSSRSDTPVFPHFFCSKLSANHHHSYYHFSGFLPNRSHRSIPPSLLPTHPVISVPTPADMPWKLPLQASQRGKYTREVDGIASDLHTPFLFQIQLSSLMDSSVEITCCRMFLKF